MKKLLKSVLLTIAIALTGQVNAALITTTFAGGNGQSGNMFDVDILGQDLIFTGFDLNLDSGTWDLEVYTRLGGYSGFQNSSVGWDLIHNSTLVSAGDGNASFLDISDTLFNSNSTYGLYITVTNGSGMNYTNGNSEGSVYVSDSFLQIKQGLGKSYAFSSSFSPRVWNGTIHYTTTDVSGPSVFGLLIVSLIGVTLRRKTK